mmetsp:Transcript_9/g.23  ORF Transcript_9/g.23 Transcript_9/m.23 type:complete len:206 (-) Transcript_9:535-1152(-)
MYVLIPCLYHSTILLGTSWNKGTLMLPSANPVVQILPWTDLSAVLFLSASISSSHTFTHAATTSSSALTPSNADPRPDSLAHARTRAMSRSTDVPLPRRYSPRRARAYGNISSCTNDMGATVPSMSRTINLCCLEAAGTPLPVVFARLHWPPPAPSASVQSISACLVVGGRLQSIPMPRILTAVSNRYSYDSNCVLAWIQVSPHT